MCDCWEVEGKRWAANFVFKPKAATFVPRLVIPWFPVNKPAPAIAAPTTNLFFPCLNYMIEKVLISKQKLGTILAINSNYFGGIQKLTGPSTPLEWTKMDILFTYYQSFVT